MKQTAYAKLPYTSKQFCLVNECFSLNSAESRSCFQCRCRRDNVEMSLLTSCVEVMTTRKILQGPQTIQTICVFIF